MEINNVTMKVGEQELTFKEVNGEILVYDSNGCLRGAFYISVLGTVCFQNTANIQQSIQVTKEGYQ